MPVPKGRLLELIRSEDNGMTRDEMAERLSVPESEIQPGIRALLDDHAIFEMSAGTIGGDRFVAID